MIQDSKGIQKHEFVFCIQMLLKYWSSIIMVWPSFENQKSKSPGFTGFGHMIFRSPLWSEFLTVNNLFWHFLQTFLFCINFSLAQVLIVISSFEIFRKVGSDKGKVGGSKNDSKGSIQNQQNIFSSWRHRLFWGRIRQLMKIAVLKENKTGLQLVSRPVELVQYFRGWGWLPGSVSGADRHKTKDRTGVTSCNARNPF